MTVDPTALRKMIEDYDRAPGTSPLTDDERELVRRAMALLPEHVAGIDASNETPGLEFDQFVYPH